MGSKDLQGEGNALFCTLGMLEFDTGSFCIREITCNIYEKAEVLVISNIEKIQDGLKCLLW